MISAFWHENGETQQRDFAEIATHAFGAIPNDVSVWVHLEDPTPAEAERVFRDWCGVHDLVFEDIVRNDDEVSGTHHHPKVEEFTYHLFMIVRTSIMPERGENEDTLQYLRRIHGAQVSVVLNTNVIVSYCSEVASSIQRVASIVQREGWVLQRGPDYVAALILEHTIEDLYDIADMMEERMLFLQDAILNHNKTITMTRLMEHRRRVHIVRSAVIHQQNVVSRLARAESKFVADDEAVFYRNVMDHTVRVLDRFELIRENIDGLVDLYFSMANIRLNNVMQRLTVISTIFLPITFITSWYGMNFEGMPELSIGWMYPTIGVFIVVVAITMLLLAKRKGWLA